MKITGCVALVTGANRGVGAAFIVALLARGATRVYAAMRDPAGYGVFDDRIMPLQLDITNKTQIVEAAQACSDLNLLINNAGINHNQSLFAEDSQEKAREEMDVNCFGTLEMCRQFSPVLASNGGGAIINMLSILSLVNLPSIGSYCVSKAALLSLTQALRAELAGQGTFVSAVMPGAIDTRMGNMNPPPLETPIDVANRALDAVEAGEEEVFPGVVAQALRQSLEEDPKAVEKEFAQYLGQ